MRLAVACWLAACAILAPGDRVGAQPPSGAGGGGDYRLGPEDVIQVQVWGRSDLSGPAVLDLSGKIQLFLVGEVDANGRTAAELGRYLTERYQLLDRSIPEVLVSVTGYNSRSVTVLGEVRNPGRYGFEVIPDIWAVILAGGGATAAADLGAVQVVRKEPGEGEPRTVTVDLSRGIEGTDAGELPILRPKDSVMVPSMSQAPVSGDKIQVLGAVRNPGAYRLGAAASVLGAISASGGTLPDADLRKVRLARPAAGKAVAYELDLQGYLYEARPATDLGLLPGDIITVPSRKTGLAAAMDTVLRMAPLVSVTVGLIYAFR